VDDQVVYEVERGKCSGGSATSDVYMYSSPSTFFSFPTSSSAFSAGFRDDGVFQDPLPPSGDPHLV
jgi:hypothetical protein